jgi:hypothetical protein
MRFGLLGPLAVWNDRGGRALHDHFGTTASRN